MSDWISVDDRLPKPIKPVSSGINSSKRVLVWVVKHKTEAFGHFLFDLDGEFFGMRIEGYSGDWDVSHYMEIDPPETETPEIFEGTREQLNNLGIRK